MCIPQTIDIAPSPKMVTPGHHPVKSAGRDVVSLAQEHWQVMQGVRARSELRIYRGQNKTCDKNWPGSPIRRLKTEHQCKHDPEALIIFTLSSLSEILTLEAFSSIILLVYQLLRLPHFKKDCHISQHETMKGHTSIRLLLHCLVSDSGLMNSPSLLKPIEQFRLVISSLNQYIHQIFPTTAQPQNTRSNYNIMFLQLNLHLPGISTLSANCIVCSYMTEGNMDVVQNRFGDMEDLATSTLKAGTTSNPMVKPQHRFAHELLLRITSWRLCSTCLRPQIQQFTTLQIQKNIL